MSLTVLKPTQNHSGMDTKSIPFNRFTEFLQNSDVLPIEDAYDKVGWFRRAQDIRTEAVRTYPYEVRQGSKIIATSTPDDDLEVPEQLNIFPVIDDLASDLDMFGAAYAIYESNKFGKNGKWRRLHPKTMKPKYDELGQLTHFVRRLPNSAIEERFELDALVWLWMPNKKAETGYGNGISHSALLGATAIHNIDRFQSAFFEQGALNPTLVSIEGYARLPEDERSRVAQVFKNMISGVKNAFGIRPVDGEVSVHNLMQPLRDMAMTELSSQKREDVLSAMGVPHSLVMSNAANYATATSDKLTFYDHAINGIVALIQDQLNERLFQPNGYNLLYTKDALEVYQQNEVEKATKLSNQLDRAVIDVKEYREQMALDPNPRLEAIFYERLESQVSRDEVQETAIERLSLNPMGANNSDSEAEAKSIDDLNLWQKKAVKRFDEGNPEKAFEFVSDIINPLQHAAIQSSLQIAKTIDDVKAIFIEAQHTAPLWEAY